MAALTKSQVLAENEALRNEINTLREQMRGLNVDLAVSIREHNELQGKLHAVETDLAAAEAEVKHLNTELQRWIDAAPAAPAKPVRKERPAYVMPAWQAERQAAMAEAKAIAMATGRLIKV